MDTNEVRAALVLALSALRAREWEKIVPRWEYFCPDCHNLSKHGHTATCELGNAIASVEAVIAKLDTL